MSIGFSSRPAVGPEVRMMPTPTVSPTTTAIPKASPTTRNRPRAGEAIAAALDMHYPLRRSFSAALGTEGSSGAVHSNGQRLPHRRRAEQLLVEELLHFAV